MLYRNILRRQIHTVPKLVNIDHLTQNGIPRVLTSKGFDIVWNQYQKFLCNKLTLLTAGTYLESYLPFHILINTGKTKYNTNIFNVASAIHNNHLFIENVMPSESELNEPSVQFLKRVENSFGKNWDELKDDVVTDQLDRKLIGQGWFCLVEDGNKKLRTMFIQNNGTPYYLPKNQTLDMNNMIEKKEYQELMQLKLKLQQNVNIEDWSIPIICINLFDQAYLNDYGVMGRSEYLKNCLDNLNWKIINHRLFNGINDL